MGLVLKSSRCNILSKGLCALGVIGALCAQLTSVGGESASRDPALDVVADMEQWQRVLPQPSVTSIPRQKANTPEGYLSKNCSLRLI